MAHRRIRGTTYMDNVIASSLTLGATPLTEAASFLGSADGLGRLMVARATLDPSAVPTHRTIAAHGLGVTLPAKAIIVGGLLDVVTTFTSAGADAGTIAISVEGADDIVAAIAISNVANAWDAGLHAIVPKSDTPESTGIKTSVPRTITATVAVQALTAGKAVVFLYYVQSL